MRTVEQRLKDLMDYTKCPQLGYVNYGKWGILNIEQRTFLHKLAADCLKLLFEMDEMIKTEYEKGARDVLEELYAEADDMNNKTVELSAYYIKNTLAKRYGVKIEK